jgi:hypothetical protein
MWVEGCAPSSQPGVPGSPYSFVDDEYSPGAVESQYELEGFPGLLTMRATWLIYLIAARHKIGE